MGVGGGRAARAVSSHALRDVAPRHRAPPRDRGGRVTADPVVPDVPGPAPAARKAATVPSLLAIALVFASQFAWVKPTNFSGYDEWLFISLASRGIISLPDQNRPFVLLWQAPPAALARHDVAAFYFFHATYLVCAGFLVFALCRRVLGDQDEIPLLAGIFACAFAPGD